MKIIIRPWQLQKDCQHILLDLNHVPKSLLVGIGFILGVVAMLIVYFSQFSKLESGATQNITLQTYDTWTMDDMERLWSDRDGGAHTGDDRLDVAVERKVRVLCWVMIRKSENVKARAVEVTWGRRCDTLLFFGQDPEFSAINLNVTEGKRFLASKTFACLTYIYKHHFNDADWFLKADDDTFIIMENLKYFLSDEDSNSPVYFGEHFNPYGSKYIHYNSGGAGYVMSRETLRRYGEVGPSVGVCSDPGGPEDKAIGYCLLNLGVMIGETRDRFGKTRFHYNQPVWRVVGNNKPWYKLFVGDRYREGMDTISMYPISFHYLNYYDIYMLDYTIYRLRPYGLVKAFPGANR